MEQLLIKRTIRLIFLIAFFSFFLNKFALRPWILAQESPQFLKIIVWSLPNFIEAIFGGIIITGLLFLLQMKIPSFLNQLRDKDIYLLAILLAGIYVLTQEVKWHNLGGRNVYDPNDFIASILGLLFIFGVFCKYGFKEKI